MAGGRTRAGGSSVSRQLDDTDQSFIAEAMPAFISEAREQVEAIEQLLLQLEADPGDRELLDALFRCAHTVKRYPTAKAASTEPTA